MSGRMEQDQKNELWIADKLTECPQIFTSYMVSIKRKTSMTRRAYLGYLIDYNNFMQESGINLEDVKPMHIDLYIDYLVNKGNKAQIVNAKLSSVISFYNFMVENELVNKNPCSPKKKMAVESKDKVVYMTDDEVDIVKSSVKEHDAKYSNRDICIITLGCATGLRISALLNIDIDDIDFENKSIRVIEKGNKTRDVLIGDNTIYIIKRWLIDRRSILVGDTEERALFISQKTHKRLSRYAVRDMLKKNTKELNKNITPHKMRSTCAMKLYDKTGDIYLTAQQLGHANIKNTMIYAKATDEKRRMAAEILD